MVSDLHPTVLCVFSLLLFNIILTWINPFPSLLWKTSMGANLCSRLNTSGFLKWDLQHPFLFCLPGSPLVKNLSVAILQLSESGELTYLRDKWWASSCVRDHSNHTSQALQPHDVRGLFLLLGLGLGVGLLLALLELLSRARNQAKDGKVGTAYYSETAWSHHTIVLLLLFFSSAEIVLLSVDVRAEPAFWQRRREFRARRLGKKQSLKQKVYTLPFDKIEKLEKRISWEASVQSIKRSSFLCFCRNSHALCALASFVLFQKSSVTT